jgi:hypothetical protein
MTASITEQILTALETTLSTTAGVGGRVYRDRAEAFLRAECPALLIEPDSETVTGETTCRTDRLLLVRIVILVRDGAVSQVADPIRVSVHSLLFTNPTIDGLASIIRPAQGTSTINPSVQWEPEKGDGQPGICVLSYEIGFRTLTADLTA